MKILNGILAKRFRVYVGGELERTTNFNGVYKLIALYTDFFEWNSQEQIAYWKEALKTKQLYIDTNITIKF